MVRRIILTLLIAGVLVLPGCQIFRRSQPYFGPVSINSGLGLGRASFDYTLTSSTNCLAVNDPLTLTLTLTNTGTSIYTNSLPTSVLDLRATSTISGTDQIWLWSNTAPVAVQPRTLSLAPRQSLTFSWQLRDDPSFRLVSGVSSLDVCPLIRYRDANQVGKLNEFSGGGYLTIPVGSDTALGACPATQP